jgi:hypothetical protein
MTVVSEVDADFASNRRSLPEKIMLALHCKSMKLFRS